jgi:prepilin-type processing-associated H-X9-DG protein
MAAAAVLLGAIVVFLVFPWLASSREPDHRPSCLSNLKQLSLARLMYSEDWDDRFPLHADWPEALYPYMKNREIYICPQAPDIPVGYAYAPSLSGRPSKSLQDPRAVMVFWDRLPGGSLPAFRHNEGINVGFADAHAKWLAEGAFLRALSRRP